MEIKDHSIQYIIGMVGGGVGMIYILHKEVGLQKIISECLLGDHGNLCDDMVVMLIAVIMVFAGALWLCWRKRDEKKGAE